MERRGSPAAAPVGQGPAGALPTGPAPRPSRPHQFHNPSPASPLATLSRSHPLLVSYRCQTLSSFSRSHRARRDLCSILFLSLAAILLEPPHLPRPLLLPEAAAGFPKLSSQPASFLHGASSRPKPVAQRPHVAPSSSIYPFFFSGSSPAPLRQGC